MNRILKYIFSIILLGYLTTWLAVSLYFKKQINDAFSTKILGSEEIAAISFDNARISAHPFSLGYKLEGFRELNNTLIVEYKKPVIISLNFITRTLSISANGDKIIRRKDNLDIFKINGDFRVSAGLKYSNKFKDAIKSKNSFQLVNFIKNIRIHFDETQIYHNDILIYDLKYLDQSFEIAKMPYYTKFSDLKDDLPKYVKNTNKLKILHSEDYIKCPSSFANPSIYNFEDYNHIDYEFSYDSNIDGTLNTKNFLQNVEINSNWDFKNDFMFVKGFIDYETSKKNTKNQVLADAEIIASCNDECRQKINNDFLLYSKHFDKFAGYKEKKDTLNTLIANFPKFLPDFERFGDMKFSFKGNMEYDAQNLDLRLDKLFLGNKLYNIFMNTESVIKNNKIDHLKGVIALRDYEILLNTFLDYSKIVLNNVKTDKTYINADEKYRDYFIKTIKSLSNYPDTKSEDLYFDINIDKNEAKFGNKTFKDVSDTFESLILKIMITEAEKQGMNIKKLLNGQKIKIR